MRDDERFHDDDDDVGDDAPPPARWKSALGAMVSVCVLGAVVTWSYRLGMRDAIEVPVIRAIEGVAKVRPEDPGGQRFDHQGRAVYAAMAGAEAPAAALAATPPPPALTEEDLAPPALARALERAAAAPPVAAAAPAGAAAPGAAAFERGGAASAAGDGVVDPAAEIDRLVALVLGGVAPATPAAPGAGAGAAAAAPEAPLPPRPRPSAAGIRAAAPVAAIEAAAIPAAAVVGSAPAQTSGAPAGARLQLGAYLSEEVARTMWGELRRRNGDLLAGRSPAIARSTVGGRDLFLLSAADFADAAEARRLCAALAARGEECFVAGGG